MRTMAKGEIKQELPPIRCQPGYGRGYGLGLGDFWHVTAVHAAMHVTRVMKVREPSIQYQVGTGLVSTQLG